MFVEAQELRPTTQIASRDTSISPESFHQNLSNETVAGIAVTGLGVILILGGGYLLAEGLADRSVAKAAVGAVMVAGGFLLARKGLKILSKN